MQKGHCSWFWDFWRNAISNEKNRNREADCIEEFFFRVVFPRKSQWNAGPVMFNSLKEKSDQTDCQDDHHDQKQVGGKENGPVVHLRRSESFWNSWLLFWQRVSCQWAVEYLWLYQCDDKDAGDNEGNNDSWKRSDCPGFYHAAVDSFQFSSTINIPILINIFQGIILIMIISVKLLN